ncbi:MAG: hypothetical protein AAF311_01050 [Pseudomonadota bacterium]
MLDTQTSERRTFRTHFQGVLNILEHCASEADTDRARLDLAINALFFAALAKNDVVFSHGQAAKPYPASLRAGDEITNLARDLVAGIDPERIDPAPNYSAHFVYRFSSLKTEDRHDLAVGQPLFSYKEAQILSPALKPDAARRRFIREIGPMLWPDQYLSTSAEKSGF